VLWVAVTVADGDVLSVAVTLADGVPERLGEGLGLGDGLKVPEVLGLGELLALPDGEIDKVRVGEVVWVSDVDGVMEGVTEEDSDRLAVGVRDAPKLLDGEGVTLKVGVTD
jgi:hypothetical protein